MMWLGDREWCSWETGNDAVERQGMVYWEDREWCSWETGNDDLGRQGMV